MNGTMLAAALTALLLVASVGALYVVDRGPRKRAFFPILVFTSVLAMTAWTSFGRFQELRVDVSRDDPGPRRLKARMNRPFHFHDFVHYYLGPKYFRELGYLGLYDCITLADQEFADDAKVPRRITSWVRNLEDVLTDKPNEEALASCRTTHRPRFSDARWASFKTDIRELQRLVHDDAWPSLVYDAGFNPPPTPIVVSSAITNLIPIATSSGTETFVFVTGIDLALLVVAFLVLRRAFGYTTAVVAAIFFGSSFISAYDWNGGSVLRFTWVVEIACGLAMLKRERWLPAGILLGAATCDRLFPGAFAVFAILPLAVKARSSTRIRAGLLRYLASFGGTVVILGLLGGLVFGFDAWATFFTRIVRHGDVYYVMHIGLKKVCTYADWVANQNFHGHDGLIRFKSWNEQLRERWTDIRPWRLPLQLLLVAGAVWASVRRRSYEAALLGGVVCMFVFSLPANYYYCVLALVPALLFRAAATAPKHEGRYASLAAFVLFTVFWVFSIVAPHVEGNQITHNYFICLGLLVFYVGWMAAWGDRPLLRRIWALVVPTDAPAEPGQ